MRLLFQIFVFIVGGTSLGYCTADYAMTNGIRAVAVTNGPWKTWPSVAQPNADPYTRAHFAETGKLTVTAFEAITFRAVNDSEARPLDGSCDYTIKVDQPPPARWWSFTLYGEDRKPISNPAERHSFNSTNTLRDTDGSFSISISHRVSPGNWLPAVDGDDFFLLYRLYNADQRIANDIGNAVLPQIVRGECR